MELVRRHFSNVSILQMTMGVINQHFFYFLKTLFDLGFVVYEMFTVTLSNETDRDIVRYNGMAFS